MSSDWPVASALLAGRYRLVSLLETGGMAEIWRAEDELLDRPVAIKLPTGPQVVWREARMAARLSHPGIAAVHDYREAVRPDGTVMPFVVMELLAGESVAARVDRELVGWAEAIRVGAAVADALAAAHASGVVHRDIKPGNVMLTPNGVKILDFGISVAAGEPDDDDTGATFGTPAYVAPERLDGMPAEPATDVYGVGVLLFEMVTGDPPYPVETWEELAAARVAGPSELPESLPADFREVVEHCLNPDPAKRPTAARLRADLLAVALRSRPAFPTAAPSPTGHVPGAGSSRAKTGTALAEPVEPPAAEPDPTEPAPTEPGPTQPGPTQPGPTEIDPTQPGPTQPDPTELDPAAKAPGPTPTGPAAPGPISTELATTGPAATGLTINGLAATGPAANGSGVSGSGAAASGSIGNLVRSAGPLRTGRPPRARAEASSRRTRANGSGLPERTESTAVETSQGRPRAGFAFTDGDDARAWRPGGQPSGDRSPRPKPGPDGSRRPPATRSFATGRASAATVEMEAAPRRRVAFGVGAALVLAALIGVFAMIVWTHRDTDTDRAIPPPATTPALPTVTTTTASPAPSSAPSSRPSPQASLTFADAVSRMRAAVKAGVASGQIRPDVAQDLLNLLGPLSRAQGSDVQGQIAALRRKVQIRVSEGGVRPARGAVLLSRLADLDRAAGT